MRQRLYDAALSRFRADGYDDTSVAAICKEAGVAKGTFFNHFPSKADILAIWYGDAMDKAEKARSTGHPASFRAALVEWPLIAVKLAAEEPELWRAKHAHAPLSREIQTAETNADNVVRENTLALLETVRADGLLREVYDLPAIVELYLATSTGTIREWLNTGGHFDLADTLRSRIDTLVDLISA